MVFLVTFHVLHLMFHERQQLQQQQQRGYRIDFNFDFIATRLRATLLFL